MPLTEQETKGMFIDILPELPPDDGVAKVSFYVDGSEPEEEILRKVNEGLDEMASWTDLGARTIAESETEDKDWINNWKQYFKPFTVDHILIKPTWRRFPRSIRTSFWYRLTREPPSARESMRPPSCASVSWKQVVKEDTRLLDVGTGSGILGITALKLGAKEVKGTDLDENAIVAVGEN